MKTITLEEHFITPEFMQGPGRELMERFRENQDPSPLALIYAHMREQLADLDELRIADMDAAGIDVQVLSLNSPGVEQLDPTAAVTLARQANDYLEQPSSAIPTALAGLPPCQPPARISLRPNWNAPSGITVLRVP